jgi:hypothetical protein
MSRFDYVWLSTDAQISSLTEAYRRASLAIKLLGTYDLGNDVTHIRGILTPWMRIATVFVAEGALVIDGASVSFAPKARLRFGWLTRRLRSDLSFRFSAPELAGVEAANIPSPFARFFDIPFTRIRTVHPAPLDNFLLCVGGRISMPRIREQSLQLREMLQKMVVRSAEATGS